MSVSTPFSLNTLRALALIALAVRIALLVVVHPFMDETYYWMWGQHPALSYFDHPALIGWSTWLASQFGWNIVALRLPVLVTLIADLALLQLIVGLDRDADWPRRFWLTVLVFLVTPAFVLATGVALPDHLLVPFGLLTVYAVRRIDLARASGQTATAWLYLAGLAIGLATLSKYTGVLLAAAFLIHLILRHRSLLRSPHPYGALLLVLLLQTPVIVWNVQHDFASFGFILGGRRALSDSFLWSGLAGFLSGAVAVLSPFLLVPIARLLRRPDLSSYGAALFVLSSAAFLLASLRTDILIHWNLLAYVGVLPFLALVLQRRWVVAALSLYGALGLGFAAVNYGVIPVLSLVTRADQTTAWSYGWDEVAAAVRAADASGPVGFIAATDYTLASPLGFALRDPAVTSLSPRTEAYDFWFDGPAHRGQSAIIVADRWRGLSKAIAAQFARIELIVTVHVIRYGRTINTVTVYRGLDYRASSQAQ